MAEANGKEVPPTLPRWELTIRPAPGASLPEYSLGVDAKDVVAAEVAHALLQMAVALVATPVARLPTRAEVIAEGRRRKLAAEKPATVLYMKGGKVLWLCAESLKTKIIGPEEAKIANERSAAGEDANVEAFAPTLKEKLENRGWAAGPVPKDVQRPCDYVLDAEDVLAQVKTSEVDKPEVVQ